MPMQPTFRGLNLYRVEYTNLDGARLITYFVAPCADEVSSRISRAAKNLVIKNVGSVNVLD